MNGGAPGRVGQGLGQEWRGSGQGGSGFRTKPMHIVGSRNSMVTKRDLFRAFLRTQPKIPWEETSEQRLKAISQDINDNLEVDQLCNRFLKRINALVD